MHWHPGWIFMWARYHFKDLTKNMKLQKSDFLVIISTRLLQTFKFLTCQRGLANQLCSNPAFLFSDMSARKFQNPLKSFTSRLSESLGNNMPGNLPLVEPMRRWKMENKVRRAKIDSIAAVSHAGVTRSLGLLSPPLEESNLWTDRNLVQATGFAGLSRAQHGVVTNVLSHCFYRNGFEYPPYNGYSTWHVIS